MKASEFVCEVAGCGRRLIDGWTIHRTSPKGGPFRGRCEEHFTGEVDEVTRILSEPSKAWRKEPERGR